MTTIDNIASDLSLADFTSNKPLVIEVQKKLSDIGLLDPPPDGKFGAVSTWALREFAKKTGFIWKGGLDGELARALRDSKGIYHCEPKNDLPGKIVSAMLHKGYWICLHPLCYNIVYIEGMDPSGKPNDNASNRFNDIRTLIQIVDGVPLLVNVWEGTTAPSKYWTEHRMNPRGAAMIKFGQYKSWVVGMHRNDHQALTQAEDVTVFRDSNENFKRDDGKEYTGIFGINQHWGYDLPKNDLGHSSAGCLVGRTKKGHREFMALIKSDARYKASHGYKFMTTILPASDL